MSSLDDSATRPLTDRQRRMLAMVLLVIGETTLGAAFYELEPLGSLLASNLGIRTWVAFAMLILPVLTLLAVLACVFLGDRVSPMVHRIADWAAGSLGLLYSIFGLAAFFRIQGVMIQGFGLSCVSSGVVCVG